VKWYNIEICAGLMMIVLLLTGGAQASTLVVCPSECTYSNIQGAIDAASSGDTVEVQNGTYYENVYINKRLTLRGIGMPEVNGGENADAFTLAEDGIWLEGFQSQDIPTLPHPTIRDPDINGSLAFAPESPSLAFPIRDALETN